MAAILTPDGVIQLSSTPILFPGGVVQATSGGAVSVNVPLATLTLTGYAPTVSVVAVAEEITGGGGISQLAHTGRVRTEEQLEAERIRLGILPAKAKAIQKAAKKATGKTEKQAKVILAKELKKPVKQISVDYSRYFAQALFLAELQFALQQQALQEQQETEAIIYEMAQYQADLAQRVADIEAAEEADIVFMMTMMAA